MKAMKKNITSTVLRSMLAVVLVIASSCDLEDHLVNPSTLRPDQADNEFVYNSVQLSFAGFFLNATQFGMDNTRMLAMFGSTYANSYTPDNFNGIWSNGYSDFMVNANLLLDNTKEDPATTELEYNAYYQGVTKVLKAYVLITLVDYFGDIPYSEAFDPSNFNPVADAGSEVYNSAFTLLTEAVADLTAVTANTIKPTQELYYEDEVATGSEVKWRTLARTLMLKIHLQRRLVDAGAVAAFDALVTAGDIINSQNEEFIFTAPANSQNAPNTFHPWFYGSYQISANQYMSNSYMKEMFDGKGFKDPRIRYYFYRQVNEPTDDVNELTCSSATLPPLHYPPGTAYCDLQEGYWGRDHLNDEGIPPDGLKRTAYGLYPAGGRFDADDDVPVDDEGLESGAAGQGILPIMTESFVLFMRAEVESVKGNAPGARTLLQQAVQNSIDRVMNFRDDVVDPAFKPSPSGVTNYVNAVLALYDAATPVAPNATVAENQLDVIIREYWLALFGNGVEAYNTYRRTGKPTRMQPALNPSPGEFYRSFTYPAAYVNRNSSAVQKTSPAVQVFWDTNAAGFIK